MLHAVPYQLRSWKCHGRSAHTPHGSLDSRACGLLVSFCTCRASIHSGFLSSPKKSLPPRAPPRRSACPLRHHPPRAAMPPVLHHRVLLLFFPATSGMVHVVRMRPCSYSPAKTKSKVRSPADAGMGGNINQRLIIYSIRYGGNSMKQVYEYIHTYYIICKVGEVLKEIVVI